MENVDPRTIFNEPELDGGEYEYVLAEPSSAERLMGENTDSAPKPENERTEINRYGWFPVYRDWVENAWWWAATPWSCAQLFLYLLIKANRRPRTTRYLHRIIQIERGCVATSFSKLAERSGLNRKTVTRHLKDFELAGELKFLDRGSTGILLSICHYDRYARDPAPTGQGNGQRSAQLTDSNRAASGQPKGTSRGTPQE